MSIIRRFDINEKAQTMVFNKINLLVVVMAISSMAAVRAECSGSECTSDESSLLQVNLQHLDKESFGLKTTAKSLSVMTFNLYGQSATGHNLYLNKMVKQKELNDLAIKRYGMAVDTILEIHPDLVFLQECEVKFFDTLFNPAAVKLLEKYKYRQCVTALKGGTAVLVKNRVDVVVGDEGAAAVVNCVGGDDVQLNEEYSGCRCVGGNRKPDGPDTGGKTKTATLVPLKVAGRTNNAVSVHFAYDGMPTQRLEHAKLISTALGTRAPTILGGDFNSDPKTGGSEDEECPLETLERSPLFDEGRHLHRVHLAGEGDAGFGTASGSFDFSEVEHIDHIYISTDAGLTSSGAQAVGHPVYGKPGGHDDREGEQAGPYRLGHHGVIEAVRPSDHVPVLVQVSVET